MNNGWLQGLLVLQNIFTSVMHIIFLSQFVFVASFNITYYEYKYLQNTD